MSSMQTNASNASSLSPLSIPIADMDTDGYATSIGSSSPTSTTVDTMSDTSDSDDSTLPSLFDPTDVLDDCDPSTCATAVDILSPESEESDDGIVSEKSPDPYPFPTTTSLCNCRHDSGEHYRSRCGCPNDAPPSHPTHINDDAFHFIWCGRCVNFCRKAINCPNTLPRPQLPPRFALVPSTGRDI